MLVYVLKRILIFIPTFLVISIITLIISTNTPGDPVDLLLRNSNEQRASAYLEYEKNYTLTRHELGLDLPVFYFSFTSYAMPDKIRKIPWKKHRYMLKRLVREFGNWHLIAPYYDSLLESKRALAKTKGEEGLNEIRLRLNRLMETYESDQITLEIKWLIEQTPSYPEVHRNLSAAGEGFSLVQSGAQKWKNFIPWVQFHGFQNQYHRWLFGSINGSKGFIRGDFGVSYYTKRPIRNEIAKSVSITLQLSLLAILLTYLIAVPLGITTASRRGKPLDKWANTILFVLYSLPAFWVGSLLIIYFGGGDYFSWFPPYGLGDIRDEMTFFQKIAMRLHHLVLPVICLVYPTLAFVSRQSRGSLIKVLNQDYIKTAYAKGLPRKKVIWKHAFKNSLLPVITMIANVFPYAIAGSFVVEIVFSIPGMGKRTLDAFYQRDFPVVYTIVILSAIMTMVGYLVADILYALIDPRISFSRKRN